LSLLELEQLLLGLPARSQVAVPADVSRLVFIQYTETNMPPGVLKWGGGRPPGLLKHSHHQWVHVNKQTWEDAVMCSSETSVDFQRTTRRCIPEDRTVHNHRRENLKPYKFMKSYVFWDITPSNPLKVSQYFGALFATSFRYGFLLDLFLDVTFLRNVS
jgi:hypothetical protein